MVLLSVEEKVSKPVPNTAHAITYTHTSAKSDLQWPVLIVRSLRHSSVSLTRPKLQASIHTYPAGDTRSWLKASEQRCGSSSFTDYGTQQLSRFTWLGAYTSSIPQTRRREALGMPMHSQNPLRVHFCFAGTPSFHGPRQRPRARCRTSLN